MNEREGCGALYLRPMSEPERLQLATMLHDRRLLDTIKAMLASIPAERRSAVAKRALALHLAHRAGRPPSTYLAAALARRGELQTKL